MNQRERDDLDRHITGNYGEDQLREQPGACIWDDCGNDAIYCEGHAREYMAPDIDALRAQVGELVEALTKAADTFRDFARADRAIGKPIRAAASEVAEEATRAVLAKCDRPKPPLEVTEEHREQGATDLQRAYPERRP